MAQKVSTRPADFQIPLPPDLANRCRTHMPASTADAAAFVRSTMSSCYVCWKDAPHYARPGRPRTGPTTQPLAFRLPTKTMEELRRRAEGLNLSPGRFVAEVMLRELTHRPGQATRKRAATRKSPPDA